MNNRWKGIGLNKRTRANKCLVFLLAVKKGDRVAQLVCERICYPELEEQEVKSTMFTAVVFDLYETKLMFSQN